MTKYTVLTVSRNKIKNHITSSEHDVTLHRCVPFYSFKHHAYRLKFQNVLLKINPFGRVTVKYSVRILKSVHTHKIGWCIMFYKSFLPLCVNRYLYALLSHVIILSHSFWHGIYIKKKKKKPICFVQKEQNIILHTTLHTPVYCREHTRSTRVSTCLYAASLSLYSVADIMIDVRTYRYANAARLLPHFVRRAWRVKVFG